jgi:hypothetical protein
MRRVEFLNTNLLQRDKSTKRTEHVSPLRVQMIVARDSVFGVLAAYVMFGITLGELAVICSEARRRPRWHSQRVQASTSNEMFLEVCAIFYAFVH